MKSTDASFLCLLLDRLAIAKSAELYEIVPGAHVYLSEKGENALYVVLSGSAKVEVRGSCTRGLWTINQVAACVGRDSQSRYFARIAGIAWI